VSDRAARANVGLFFFQRCEAAEHSCETSVKLLQPEVVEIVRFFSVCVDRRPSPEFPEND
jgi:hypothetical protein